MTTPVMRAVLTETTVGTSLLQLVGPCPSAGDLAAAVAPSAATSVLLVPVGATLFRTDPVTRVPERVAGGWASAGTIAAFTTDGGGGRVLALSVPVDAVREYGDPDTFAPPRDGALLDCVRSFLLGLSGTGRSDAMAVYFLERLLWEMAASLVVHTRGIAQTTRLALHLRDQAEAHITAYRTDPELTPESVARSMNVSLRQLQRAFAEVGSSPFAEIRRQRAEHAEALLADPAFRPLGVEEVARHVGFGDAAQMRRALQLLGRPTPRALRRRSGTTQTVAAG